MTTLNSKSLQKSSSVSISKHLHKTPHIFKLIHRISNIAIPSSNANIDCSGIHFYESLDGGSRPQRRDLRASQVNRLPDFEDRETPWREISGLEFRLLYYTHLLKLFPTNWIEFDKTHLRWAVGLFFITTQWAQARVSKESLRQSLAPNC